MPEPQRIRSHDPWGPIGNYADSRAHPVDVLQDEHRVIACVLDAMQREGELSAVLAVRRSFWQAALDFLENFADRLHHAKEEGLLFPALEAAGMRMDHGPTMVLRQEHVQEREVREQLALAVVQGQTDALLRALRRLTVLLRLHIRKEDKILFRMAREILGRECSLTLLDRFSRIDTEVLGSRAHDGYLQLARELCGSAGRMM